MSLPPPLFPSAQVSGLCLPATQRRNDARRRTTSLHDLNLAFGLRLAHLPRFPQWYLGGIATVPWSFVRPFWLSFSCSSCSSFPFPFPFPVLFLLCSCFQRRHDTTRHDTTRHDTTTGDRKEKKEKKRQGDATHRMKLVGPPPPKAKLHGKKKKQEEKRERCC